MTGPPAADRLRVALLATGGTIACIAGPDGRMVPGLTPEELVASVPALKEVASIRTETLRNVSGFDMGPERMVEVARRARELLLAGAVGGVVVTHGTDTTEETMYMCEMLAGEVTGRGPIVFACAMRASTESGADGPRNLLNAVRIASSLAARGRGVLLTVNDRIHCASWVSKLNTLHVETFQSVRGGPVGSMQGGEPVFVLDSPSSPRGRGIRGDVPLVKAYTGMQTDVFDWHLDRGVDGLVVEGTGAGNVPSPAAPGIARLVDAGLPVIVTSRCPYGLPESPYGGAGGGASLDDLGVLRAGHLNGPKARLALMVGLHETSTFAQLGAWLSDIG
ncbi:MAG: asparaginase [Acidimicrobiaceae bacterium]|nr:asparaginase [Acidimicrobiaceae bacterium]